jgi:HK97 family phage major capsid protein
MAQVDEDLKQIKDDLKATGDQLKTYAEQTKTAVQASKDLSEGAKAKVDELLLESADLKARMAQTEQLIAKLDNNEGKTSKSESLGELFTAYEGFEEFAAKACRGVKGSFSVPIKMAITSLPGSAGVNIQPQRIGMLQPLNQRLFLRDLLASGRTTSNSIEYVRESGFTNNANVVSETVQKPESNITFEMQSAPIVTIAHWIKASRQVLADVPMLQSYIDNRLRYGLMLKEEQQLLKGSGVGININGLYTQASDYLNPGVTVQNETSIDRLRIAMLQVVLAELDPDGIVLSPIDWTTIELLKNDQNNYLFTQPQGVATPTLWGQPVVATQAMDAGEFLVGSFKQGAQIWDREDISVQVASENQDDFIKNMVTILCEERVGLTVYRDEAFVKGDLVAVS